MLKKILGVFAVVVVALVAFIATRPAAFAISRSAVVAAPPAVVFAQVNDYKARKAWYPWEAMDPNQTRTYSEPSAGVGAWYEWKGNDQVGSGRQEMLESVEGTRIVENLQFKDPMPADNTVRFEFTPEGQGTRVVWTMSGENGFMGKAFSLVMDMDKMVGPDFERGLASLGKVSEEAWSLKQRDAAAAAEKAAEEAAAAANGADADGAEGDDPAKAQAAAEQEILDAERAAAAAGMGADDE